MQQTFLLRHVQHGFTFIGAAAVISCSTFGALNEQDMAQVVGAVGMRVAFSPALVAM
jgi:hypothetical protein